MNKSLILVVEDDTSVRNLITTTLKTHEYRYLTAPDGQSAILETSSHNPDIVLLDLGLPDIDGTRWQQSQHAKQSEYKLYLFHVLAEFIVLFS